MKWAAAVVLIAACEHADPQPPSPRHDDPMGAVKACERAMVAPPTPGNNLPRRVAACAGVIVDPTCRAAFLDVSDSDAHRVERLRATCAAAYCPSLPDPKPAACGDPHGDPDDLWHAIYLYDLGPRATAAFEAATAPLPPLAPGRWRVPLVAITKDAVELDWRSPGAPNRVWLVQPLASWQCPPLRDALIGETRRTWGATPVRPADSEQLLVSVERGAPDATVFAIMKCVNDPSDPRPPYQDVVIQPESPK